MRLRFQSGNVVLGLLFGLFLLGLAGGIWFVFSPNSGDQASRATLEARAAYDEAVSKLEKVMSNPNSFEASLDRNSSFHCLYSGDGNCKGQGGTFLFYESAGSQRPLSHLATDAGSDLSGAPCRGFPSKDCPLRVETVWEPVCAGPACEGTKSVRVRAKVTLASMQGTEAPLQWSKENMFSPLIRLTQSAQCDRGGGVWTGTECLTPSQAAERRIASPGNARADASSGPAESSQEVPREGETPQPLPQVVYECPNQIVVQGQYYPVQFLSADRAQVSVPAMSCPAPGYFDVFVFQCSAKTPAAFPNEGQWIQVEAAMAPPCTPDGQPLGNGNLPTRF